ncbi:hypothetical protein AJ80_06596 [Polytolypa hystricis UAMH7299]|uniref:RGS domain-containing protein n=1 Tax=Polytolypa hystricis (strain UAMH7299) TaxID=1447883 RepID=A0A2B7XVX0_POLH7|nr:hypothetical protein AJ80_06596 [Polytolypa hystricis UAMH7299]
MPPTYSPHAPLKLQKRPNPSHPHQQSTTSSDPIPDHTLTSLEHVLSTSPAPLLHYATSHAFSGENILFLLHVRDWKASWTLSRTRIFSRPYTPAQGGELRHNLFAVAVELYLAYVNINTADVPVNLESAVYRKLTDVLGHAAKVVVGNHAPTNKGLRVDILSSSPVTPFASCANDDGDFFDTAPNSTEEPNTFSSSNATTTETRARQQQTTTTIPPSSSKTYEKMLLRSQKSIKDLTSITSNNNNLKNKKKKHRLPKDMYIPVRFDETIFDDAVASIKLLVLRDTWPKYIEYLRVKRKEEEVRTQQQQQQQREEAMGMGDSGAKGRKSGFLGLFSSLK